jgi:hypothetical protein
MEGYRLLRLDDDMVTASHGRVPRYASGARFALRYSGVKVRVLEVLVASSLGLAVVKSCGKEGALGDRRWPAGDGRIAPCVLDCATGGLRLEEGATHTLLLWHSSQCTAAVVPLVSCNINVPICGQRGHEFRGNKTGITSVSKYLSLTFFTTSTIRLV